MSHHQRLQRYTFTLLVTGTTSAATALAVTPALAQADLVRISSERNDPVTLEQDQLLRITPSGFLRTPDDDAISLDGNPRQIHNEGTIRARDHNGIHIGDNLWVEEGIDNEGEIEAEVGVRDEEGSTDVSNSGVIRASETALHMGDDDSGWSGALDNSGTIEAVEGAAIEVEGTWSGSYRNTGGIYSTNTAIDVDGDFDGDFINSGTIESLDDTAVDVDDINGDLRNSGAIHAEDTGIDADDIGGDFENTGEIIAKDYTIDADDLQGDFINSGSLVSLESDVARFDDIEGNFRNSGLIESAGDDDGFYISDYLRGDFDNSGTIRSLSDTAFYVSDSIQGDVRNTGLIEARDTAFDVRDDIEGDFENTGEIISLTSTAVDVSNIEGDFVNSGLIEASSDALDASDINGRFENTGKIISRDSTGVDISDVTGDFINSGIIDAQDTAVDASDIDGDFRNTGTILSRTSYGVDISDVGGDFVNSGLIEAYETGVDASDIDGNFENIGEIISREYDGVDINDVNGDLVNSGLIEAYGTAVDTSDIDGEFRNTGRIISQSNTGIEIGELQGNFYNSGTIDAGDTGVIIEDEFGETFRNSGTIQAEEIGVLFEDDVDGARLLNEGEILAGSEGIEIEGYFRGTLRNDGLIQASDEALLVEGRIEQHLGEGGLINNGDIVSTGDRAVDMDIDQDDVEVNVENNGLIEGQDTAIYIDSDDYQMTLDIRNHGTIVSRSERGIRGNADDDEVAEGEIVNSGEILAREQGIFLDQTFEGTIRNPGSIVSRGSDSVIQLDRVGEGATIESSGDIISRAGGDAIELDGDEGARIEILGGRVVGDINRSFGTGDDELLFRPSAGSPFTLEGGVSGITDVEIANGHVTIEEYIEDTGEVNVKNGATLAFAGHAETDLLSNAGRLRTDGMALDGDFEQESDAELVMLLDNDPGTVDIEDNASLEGSMRFRSTGYMEDETQWTALEADNLDADELEFMDDSAMIDFSAEVDDDDIEAEANHAGTVSEVTDAGGGENLGLADALDEHIADHAPDDFEGTLETLVTQTFSASSDEEVAQLMAHHGPVSAGQLAGSLAAADEVTGAVSGQQRGVGGTGTGVSAGDEAARNHVWLRALGSSAERDEDDVLGGYDMDTSGFALGGGRFIAPELEVGGALAIADTEVEGSGEASGTDVDIDSTFISAYATYEPGPWYLDGQFSFGDHEYDQLRGVPGEDEIAEADYDGDQWVLASEFGYTLDLDQYKVTPHAGLEHSSLSLDSYEESEAGGFGLDVDSQSLDTSRATLGARASRDFQLNGSTVDIRASAAWQRDFGDLEQDVTARFLTGGPAFETEGLDVDEDAAVLGLGSTYTTGFGAEVALDYQAELRGNYSSQRVTLDAGWRF